MLIKSLVTLAQRNNNCNTLLSIKAYGLLLILSQIADCDDITIDSLSRLTCDGKTAIRSGLKELETAGYLFRERVRGENGTFSGIRYCINMPETEEPQSENPHVAALATVEEEKEYFTTETAEILENPVTIPQSENPHVEKKREKKQKRKENYEIRYRYAPVRTYKNIKGQEDKTDRYYLKADLYDRLDIDSVSLRFGKSPAEEILELIVDTMCSNSPQMVICQDRKDTKAVKSHFSQLTKQHIEYVLECVQSVRQNVVNIKQYLLAALYNSVMTLNNYNTVGSNMPTSKFKQSTSGSTGYHKQTAGKGQKKNNFNNFPQRQYPEEYWSLYEQVLYNLVSGDALVQAKTRMAELTGQCAVVCP